MRPSVPTSSQLLNSLLLASALLCGLDASLLAQRDGRSGDDLRDVVTLKRGREVRGRVRNPFGEDELLVMQGGKRKRVKRSQVTGIDRVHDRLAAFNKQFKTAAANPRMLWMVAEWALTAELPEMAALTAWRVIAMQPDHAEAHELLGHRKHPRLGWLHRDGDTWVEIAGIDARHLGWGKAMEMRSENFVVRSNAGYAAMVDTLLDLERMYTWVFAEFGEKLQLVESLERMTLHVHASEEDFPRWGFESVPYFTPPNHGDFGATWRDGAAHRPVRLFEVGTQMILSRCLAEDQQQPEPMQRACGTAELGFAQYVEARLDGPPGLAEAVTITPDPMAADLARNARRYGLENLLHLGLRSHFYGALLTRRGTQPGMLQVRESTNIHWASAEQFVTFLLDDTVAPPRRDAFLAWLRAAVAEGKGDSSRTFDRVMGTPIEALREPFDQWLGQQGAPRRPRRR